jgi:sporulation protein YlmC with PRC-barrel domain
MLVASNIDDVTDQSHQLISSARVEGTPIYNKMGEKLGTIHSVMIHKTTGHIEYALLAFGGFFGLGSHVHPIPWQMLTYDAARHGYVADISREMLLDAPSLELDKADRPTESERPMYHYWKFDPYW